MTIEFFVEGVPKAQPRPPRKATGGVRSQFSVEAVNEAYKKTGSVWKTAKLLGLCGQSVHERLVNLGTINPMRYFTKHETTILRKRYPEHRRNGTLRLLANELGRTKQFICRKARAIGLTKRGGPVLRDGAAASRRMTEWHLRNEHPRGATGLKHTPRARQKISEASKRAHAARTPEQEAARTMKAMKTKFQKYGSVGIRRAGTTWKAGWRVVAGRSIYFRSRWEHNYALYLQMLVEQRHIKSWEHEPETFWFEKIKRGCRSYLPDFRVTNPNGSVEYHEVKGWMDPRSKTKIARMKRYHPSVVLRVIGAAWFKANSKKLSFLKGWEVSRGF